MLTNQVTDVRLVFKNVSFAELKVGQALLNPYHNGIAFVGFISDIQVYGKEGYATIVTKEPLMGQAQYFTITQDQIVRHRFQIITVNE